LVLRTVIARYVLHRKKASANKLRTTRSPKKKKREARRPINTNSLDSWLKELEGLEKDASTLKGILDKKDKTPKKPEEKPKKVESKPVKATKPEPAKKPVPAQKPIGTKKPEKEEEENSEQED
jgi:hypothetical protein